MDWGSVIDQADSQQSQGDVSSTGAATSAGLGTSSTTGAPTTAPTSPSSTAGAPADSNPWRDVIDQADAATTQQAQLSLYANRDADPDKAARAAQLGQQMGVPAPAVEADLPGYEQRSQVLQNANILKGNPALASWVAANPLAPRVAQDDFQNLDTLSQAAAELRSGWSGAFMSNQLARDYYAGSAVDPAVVSDLESSMQAATADPAAHGLLHGLAGFVGGFADMAAHAAQLAAGGLVTGAAIGGTAAGIPTGGTAAPIGAVAGGLVGAAAGFGAGVFTDAFKVGYGNLSHTLAGIKDASGNGIDPIVQVGASMLGGLVNGALNTFGLKFGAQPVADAAASLVNDGIAQAVARPTVASALANFAGNLAKSGLTGAALGSAMEGSNVLAEEAAKQLSVGDFQTVFNDPATRAQAVDRIAESAAQMALLMGAMHGVGGLPPLLGDTLRARQAVGDMTTFQNLQDGAAASKVRGRAPSLFEDWMQRQTDGTPVENLFIPADRVAELYQSVGSTPGTGDGLFGNFVPDIADQIRQGQATGGDVVVPTSGYLTHLAGTDISQRLQPDIRVRQDGMSLNDVAQFQEAYSHAMDARNAELQQQGAEQAARTSAQEQIFNDVRTQASQAGFGADAAKQYASLYAARYATRAERLGDDPLDSYRGEGVQITRQDAPPLTNTAPDSLDVMLNALRSGKADTPDPSLLGSSLLQFLAQRGGVEDVGGDLKSMDADKWHLGKPGTRRLVRPSRDQAGAALPGMGEPAAENDYTPDAATRAAWEAGYFPEHAERPTVSDLHDAIREELAGQPRYSEQGVSNAEQFRAATEDLSNTLGRIGIDPAKATNAELRRALDQHLQDGGGRTYDQDASMQSDAAPETPQQGQEAGGVPASTETPAIAAQPAEASATLADKRGSIRLGDGQAVISLFAKRDLSTLLHETGHLWLDEMMRDSERPDAPQQIRDDMATILKWLGVESGGDIGTAEHELFARGVEAYLMEGKAPSLALRGAFSRFKAWLARIYRTVTSLQAPVSPEMRNVFDRLLASDDEIERARDAQGLRQLFRTPADAGMTDAEFRVYTALVDRARSEGADGLTRKVMADVRRTRTADWREAEAPIREDMTREVDARPDMKALRLFRTGKPDGVEGEGQRIRLDREAITDSYGSDSVLKLLPHRVPPIYSDTGGMHPDLVAEMLGMRSGNDLLKALMTHEAQRQDLLARGDKRSVRQYEIDDQTYARMVERHGDALQDGSIESDALDQVHSERQAEVLGAELKALGRRTGKTATPTQAARAWAEHTISEKQVGDGTKPQVYLRAEGKAGNAAMRAVLAGDHEEAFRQKQLQLLNHSLYLAAKAARDDVARGTAVLDRFGAKAEFPTISPGYVDRIHDLLRRFQVPLKRDPAELDRALGKTTLEKWATDRIAEGHEIYIAPDLYDPTFARPTSTLTVSQFRDLADTVRSIAHVGRAEQQVIVDGVKADREDTVQQMVAQLQDLPQPAARDFVNQGGRTGIKGAVDRAGDAAGRFHAMLLKPEAVIDRLDRDDPNGVFNKAVWRPIKEAQAHENELRAEMVERFRAIREDVGKDYGKDFDRSLPDQPELTDQRTGGPMALKKRGLIGIALNMGNESNMQRLLDGYGWTADGVKAALDRNMTSADWRYVQGVWDAFESLFPRIEDMQRRMTGVGLDKVEAREVETPHGTFRGGYYPVVYDPNLSLLGDRIRASGDQRFEADYVRATTPKGHTVARVDSVSEPLSLDPDIIHWKIGQAVHDLAYREAVVQADKLLRDRRVMTAIDDAEGRDARKQLDSWLQGVANERNIDTRGLAAMDAFMHRMRTNAMVVGIGFRATTVLKHGITALSNSLGELGPQWMLRGSTEYFGSFDKMSRNYHMITGKSAEMRFRMNEIDRDVREVLQDIQGKTGLVSSAVRFSHYGVATVDMLSALPTWLGAYRKAEAGGMEEGDAVAFADKTVRNAHGANGAPDLAAIQRGGEAQKLFTMFYGFFNHIYNRQVVGVRAAGDAIGNVRQGNFGAARSDFAKSLSTFFFYLAVPAIIEGLVSKGGPNQNDDEGWLGWAAKQIAGEVPAGVPVLRDVAKAAIDGRGYEMSPVAQEVDNLIKAGRDVQGLVGLGDKPASSRWVQHVIETPGYLLGLPTGQAAGTAQFLTNVASGTEDPQGVGDWLRGVIYGPAPKHAAGVH